MKRIILTLAITAVFTGLTAQDVLSKKLTIKLQNKPVGTILDIISETNGFYFSYNPSVIKTNKITSVHADDKTVQQVLDMLFEGKTQYQQISNHIIIKPKPIVKAPKKTSKKVTKYYYNTNGYIRDKETGLGLSAISVFEKNGLNNTLSEDFGYYQLSYTSKRPQDSIFFASPLIKDTVIVVNGTNQPSRNDLSFQLEYEGKKLQPLEGIEINSDSLISEPLTIQIDTLDRFKKLLAEQKSKLQNLGIGDRITNKTRKISTLNITDSFKKSSQVSLISPIGTNGQLSNKVSNTFSLNIIAGNNGGLHGVEVGGVANIIANNVEGVQIAGFGNYVKKNVSGIQIAGFSNHNLGTAKGTTIAGFYNYQADSLTGSSIAGFMNSHKENLIGAQIAGFSNKARHIKGAQIAGFSNCAKNVTGTQIAGFINQAQHVKGTQIGFINIADSVDGVQLGFLNIAKHGLHQLEVGYSYSQDHNLAFRTGTERLYTIIGARISQAANTTDPWFGFSYGLGGNIKLHPKAILNIQATAYQPTHKLKYDYLRLHNQLNLNVEFRPVKFLAVFAGSGLGVNVMDYADPNLSELRSKYGDQYVLDNGFSTHVSMNPTWQFGLRFF